MKKKDFNILSYKKHQNFYKNYSSDICLQNKDDSFGIEVKNKLYSFLDSIISLNPGSSWLVIGDGRYAEGANYINSKGGEACPTDIDTRILKEMKKKGLIKEYSEQNAENLTLGDESFDFVLCKDSFHHFPRPYLGLYEMIRVAKKGVILIEPQEWAGRGILGEMFAKIRVLVRKISGKQDIDKTYEEAGNLVFRLSLKEVRKISKALNFHAIMWKESNEFYKESIYSANKNSPGVFFHKILVKLVDFAVFLGAAGTTLSICVFKESLEHDQIEKLKKHGVRFEVLPKNPFIEDNS